jgi:membrane peptidoglycan carboxypeptidase
MRCVRRRSHVVAGPRAIEALRDSRGHEIPILRLDPLLIGSIFPTHGEDRIVVTPAEVPTLLPAALKAVEDRKFDSHHGVDPEAVVARAVGQSARASDCAGWQHAHAAAREELLPRFAPDDGPQGCTRR